MNFNEFMKKYPHYFEDCHGMGFLLKGNEGTEISVGSDRRVYLIENGKGEIISATEGEWVTENGETFWKKGKKII